jgi:hypothetical protein
MKNIMSLFGISVNHFLELIEDMEKHLFQFLIIVMK